jgi:hypothetical protein
LAGEFEFELRGEKCTSRWIKKTWDFVPSRRNVFHLPNSGTGSGQFLKRLGKSIPLASVAKVTKNRGSEIQTKSARMRPGNRLKLFDLMQDL